jgi:hypothetical protein
MATAKVLEYCDAQSLNIKLIEETLSDGSKVYNVRITIGGEEQSLAYPDERLATEAYLAFSNAVDKSL